MEYYRIGTKRPEIYHDAFLSEIYELNEIVRDSGAPLEGNIFYRQNTSFAETTEVAPVVRFRNKRINFFLFTRGKKHFVEIGFNAGHSALLVLRSNPDIKVSAIDICMNKYTADCAAWMTKKFPDRFEFFPGDSREVFPACAEKFVEADLFHIDGGHSFEVAQADIDNVVKLKQNGPGTRHVIIDDIIRTKIELLLAEYTNRGFLEGETYGNRMREAPHVLMRVTKNKNSEPGR